MTPVQTYCKAGVTDGWWDTYVVDKATGETVPYVQEVDTAQGWVDQVQHDRDGNVIHKLGRIEVRRLYGDWRLERRNPHLKTNGGPT